jgi:hypothetical protein
MASMPLSLLTRPPLRVDVFMQALGRRVFVRTAD